MWGCERAPLVSTVSSVSSGSALLCSAQHKINNLLCWLSLSPRAAPPGLAQLKKSLGKSTELSDEFRNRKLINLN